MKQFDLQGNEYDCTIEIPLKKATYEDIQALNINLQTQLFVKDKEIEKLQSIIKEVRDKTIQMIANNSLDFMYRQAYKDILEILEKEKADGKR